MAFYTNVKVQKNSILCRGYDGQQPFDQKFDLCPEMFVVGDTAQETGYRTIDGRIARPIVFDTIRDARQMIKDREDSNSPLYGQDNFVSQFIMQTFGQNIQWDRSLIRLNVIDIEVESDDGFPKPEDADYPILTITNYDSRDDMYYVWGMYDYDITQMDIDGIDQSQIVYRQCDSETELLGDFLNHWGANCPDVVTGWYMRIFDIPYLVNRITKVLGPNSAKRLSPWGMVWERNQLINNREVQMYDLGGIQQLDYIDLFRKYGYTYGQQESYKLDHISHVVLGERKVSYQEHTSLHELYKNDYQKFVTYNIKDVFLVLRLDQELDFITMAMTIAFHAGVNFAETFGTVSVWDNIIYRELTAQNIVINPKTHSTKIKYPGAFVKDPMIGGHKWVASFDLNSLYPNLIIQYNMSPETIVDGKIESHYTIDRLLEARTPNTSKDCIAANGVHFRKDSVGIIPSIVKTLYEQRVTVKQEMLKVKDAYEKTQDPALKTKANMLDNKQQALKILLNSLYGAMANNYFRYFDPRIAAAITLSGQLSIRWAEKTINLFMNKYNNTDDVDYVIASDTDSLYIKLDKIVADHYGEDLPDTAEVIKFLDQFCSTEIENILDQSYDALARYVGAIENRMKMKREALADAGIWTAKKRYILNVHNNEGVQFAEPKLKVMGIEAVKSSTPQICRDKMKQAFKIAISGTEQDMQDFVKKSRDEFSSLPPEDVSFPRGVSDVESKADQSSIYKKGTPIHVRGALLYNKMIADRGLTQQYQTIQGGDKIKFTYLLTPNPIHENVISYPGFLPEELDLHQYVDYDMQFDKTFIQPLSVITEAIGWNLVKKASLESFFN